MRASNAKGQGPWSSIAGAETQAAPPEAPAAPAISQRTSTSARCKWDVPVEDHGAAVLRYRLALLHAMFNFEFGLETLDTQLISSLPGGIGAPSPPVKVVQLLCYPTQSCARTCKQSELVLFMPKQEATRA